MNSQAAINATLRTKVNTPPSLAPEHRYLPGERPRSVIMPKAQSASKVAGELSFNPVTTISASNGNTFVRPVSNTQARPVSPAVVNKDGQVSIRGEHLIELSGNLHEQIRAKVNQGISYKKETLVAPPAAVTSPVPTASPTPKPQPVDQAAQQTRSQELKKQLEEINQALFSQIREKISQEISRQQTKPQAPASDQPKQPAFKAARPIATTAVNQAAVATTTNAPKPVLPQTTPMSPPTKALEAKPTISPTVQKPLVKEAPAAVSKPLAQPASPQPVAEPTPSKTELQGHIENLEREITALTKEVSHIDQTIAKIETEAKGQELAALEQKIAYDEQLMQTTLDWRYSLTNLVNSHSIALKYLKQKTDWLEDKVEGIQGHREAHHKIHRKPREISLRLQPLPEEHPSKTTAKQLTNPVATVETQPKTEVKINIPSETSTTATAPATVEQSISQPPPVKEIIQKEEAKPAQVEAAVDKALAEKEKSEELSHEKVEKMVQEALKQQLSEQVPTQKEIPANIVVGQPKVLPGNPAAQININAIPVETSAKPKENLPTVATAAGISSQSDIEKQILESAAREDATREAVQKAKEEQEAKRKLEQEKQQQAEASIREVSSPATEVSAEALKSDLTKLKSSLTTIDNKALANLNKEERAQMMQQLDNLERQNEVSRQFDEIKGASERRKVNSQLQTMLARLGEKPSVPTTPATTPQSSSPATQVEALKVAEKKEKSPQEKAKIIAEIKALEREREARKLEERSRPVVKAQPAYGKMLPNTPTTPNVINGIVKDNKGLLMDTVVIIVKDHNGDPVRAFKTNKIGQFAVSTPLPNGTYTLELEKKDFDFDIIEVDVNGGILPPIEIKAR